MNSPIIQLAHEQPVRDHADRAAFTADSPFIRPATNPAESALTLPVAQPPAAAVPEAVAPWFQKRTRNGKIARLPKHLRDLVNRMLFNNIPLKKIVGALDELSIAVTERNVSNWKTRGGYREWCLAQNYAIQLRLHQDNLTALLRKGNVSELPEVGLQAVATQLSQFFLTPEATELFSADPAEYHRRVTTLAKVTSHLKALQKYRDDCAKEIHRNPERLRREAQAECESLRETYSSKIPDNPKIPNTPHRNYLPESV